MSAKRVTKSSIDWLAFVAKVPKNQTAECTAFKGKCDSYLRRVTTLPETLPKIHWDQYKSRVAVQGMVEEFQKQYESLQVPYPVDNYSDKITQVEKVEMEDVKKYCLESEEKIAKYQSELTRLEAMIPLTEMTLEELNEAFPELTIDLNNPTIWPHTPEFQPGYVNPDAVEEEHH